MEAVVSLGLGMILGAVYWFWFHRRRLVPVAEEVSPMPVRPRSQTSEEKGDEGEQLVDQCICALKLPYHRYMPNVTMPLRSQSNRTRQIDHVLVMTTGVFVIETKHFSGNIYGNLDAKKWRWVADKVEHEFDNPVDQNRIHWQALQEYLQLSKEWYHPIVVFTGTGEFCSDFEGKAIYLKDLPDFILKERQEVLDEMKIRKIEQLIERNRLPYSPETDEKHKENRELNKKRAENRWR